MFCFFFLSLEFKKSYANLVLTPQCSVVSRRNCAPIITHQKTAHIVNELHKLRTYQNPTPTPPLSSTTTTTDPAWCPWFIWHAITSDRRLLTKLALPMDLLLTVGPLANVDMDGRSVPPKAISTSFGGCLEIKTEKKEKKKSVNPRGVTSRLEPRSAAKQSKAQRSSPVVVSPQVGYRCCH